MSFESQAKLFKHLKKKNVEINCKSKQQKQYRCGTFNFFFFPEKKACVQTQPNCSAHSTADSA